MMIINDDMVDTSTWVIQGLLLFSLPGHELTLAGAHWLEATLPMLDTKVIISLYLT